MNRNRKRAKPITVQPKFAVGEKFRSKHDGRIWTVKAISVSIGYIGEDDTGSCWNADEMRKIPKRERGT